MFSEYVYLFFFHTWNKLILIIQSKMEQIIKSISNEIGIYNFMKIQDNNK